MSDETLGVAEVARQLGSSVSAVRKAIVRGTLPATLTPGQRRGNEYRVTREAVEQYQREHRRPR